MGLCAIYSSIACERCDWYRRVGGITSLCAMCESLATLAHNLRIAGGLCAAFELGRGWECAFRLGPGYKDNRRAFADARNFHPGCKRSAL